MMAIQVTIMRSYKLNKDDMVRSEISARTNNQFELGKELQPYPFESVVYSSIVGDDTSNTGPSKNVWYIISAVKLFVDIDSNSASARKTLENEIHTRLEKVEIIEYHANPVTKPGGDDDISPVPTNIPDQQEQPPDPNDPGPPGYEQ